MRIKLLPSLVLFIALPLLARARPDSVGGLVYFEDGFNLTRSNWSEARVLVPDGTYRGLFFENTYGSVTLSAPRDGQWTYRATGENTGELSFDGGRETRQLTFVTPDSGTLTGTSNAAIQTTGHFKFMNPAQRPTMVNCSNRATVPAGGTATAGFVLTEPENYVLVRAVGPGLAGFGVRSVLATPMLEIYSVGNGLKAQNAGWDSGFGGESIQRTSAMVGAFPLSAKSADAAMIVSLPAGAHVAQVSGATTSASGEVLIEVYVLR